MNQCGDPTLMSDGRQNPQPLADGVGVERVRKSDSNFSKPALRIGEVTAILNQRHVKIGRQGLDAIPSFTGLASSAISPRFTPHSRMIGAPTNTDE